MRGKAMLWAALAVVALAAYWAVSGMLLPAGGPETIAVQIPKGASAGEIGRILAARDVIRSPFWFRVLARAAGKSTNLMTGAYKLSPSMTPLAVLGKISSGEAYALWITCPEGFTIRQIGERLEAEGVGDADRFYELARFYGASFPTSFPHPPDSLEGYLFPDTYLAPVGKPEEKLVREMLDCFERKVVAPLASDISASGMSLHEVITLASLIEREAKIPKDRRLVSAVLRNRLARNMRLECDATVLYALGRHKNRLLYKDLAVDSPYNTYLYAGLPPGPIANPGLASIKAALRPAHVDYLYYVARDDGSHIFSRTFADHQRAKRIARKGVL
ncbi:MAG TPA: endolytic transglycosylase MltG [Armatimonadota bacterium]|nr:endolytic transglycosylase MltG [Armatimonadota bacterium]